MFPRDLGLAGRRGPLVTWFRALLLGAVRGLAAGFARALPSGLA